LVRLARLHGETEVRYGEAIIYVEKHPPAGVWTRPWFSVCYECKGCWRGCGGSHPTDDEAEVQRYLERVRTYIATCDFWRQEGKKQGPKIRRILDFRRIGRQAELGAWIG